MEDGGDSGWIEQTDDWHLKKRKKEGVFVWLIPLGVEQSRQGDFLLLMRNYLWVLYAGAEGPH